MKLQENIKALQGKLEDGLQWGEIVKTFEIAEKLAVVGGVEDEASLKTILSLLVEYAEAVTDSEAEYIEDGAPWGVKEVLNSVKKVIDKE